MDHAPSAFPSKPPSMRPVEALQIVEEGKDKIIQGTLKDIWKIITTMKSFIVVALTPVREKAQDFTQMEKEFLAQAADITFPKDGPISISGTEAGVPAYVENMVQNMPADKRKLVHLLLHFLECSPLVFGPRHKLFSQLTDEEKKEVLIFSNKSLYFRRVAAESLRLFLTMGYMANPEVQKQVGYHSNTNPFNLK